MHLLNVRAFFILFFTLHINSELKLNGKTKCQFALCAKRPSFGDLLVGKPRFCAEHKPAGACDVRNRKCQFPQGCYKQATFGNLTDRAPSFCATHRGPKHEVLHPRRCMFVHGCSKYAVFGDVSDGIARFCARHKDKLHSNVLKPWCR
jgi:hypothetical protein